MNNMFLVLAVVGGAGLSVQLILNARLHAASGSALWASLIQFAVGLAGLAVVAAFVREPFPSAGLSRAPWWLWTGGLVGAAYILLSIILVRELGAALLLATVVVGQLAASLLIDHYGWLGMPVHRLSIARVVGAALLVAGVSLIRWR